MSDPTDPCLAFDEELSASIDGELEPADEAALRAHLQGCARCSARIVALRATDARLREHAAALAPPDALRVARLRPRLEAPPAPERATPRIPAHRRRWLVPGLAAAAAAAFGVVMLRAISEPDLPAPPVIAERAAPAPPLVRPDELRVESEILGEELARAFAEAPVPRGASAEPETPAGAEAAAFAALAEASDEEVALALELDRVAGVEPGDLKVIEQLERFVESSPRPGRKPELRERLRDMSDVERRELLGRLARVRAMDPEERQALRERLARLEDLPPERRAQLERNLERWRAMSPEERDRLRSRWREHEKLPPDERTRAAGEAGAE
jgi:hypothetical protein